MSVLYSTEWRDFVIFSTHPEQGDSDQKRLNTENAYRKLSDGSLPDEYHANAERGIIVEQRDIETNEERFQAISFNSFGNVTIWTTNYMWTIARSGNGGKIERLVYSPIDHRKLEG